MRPTSRRKGFSRSGNRIVGDAVDDANAVNVNTSFPAMSRWQGHKEAVFAGALILAGLADGGLALQIRFSSDDEGGLRRGAGRHVTEDTNNARGCHALLAGPPRDEKLLTVLG
jgi:hypothetical protein